MSSAAKYENFQIFSPNRKSNDRKIADVRVFKNDARNNVAKQSMYNVVTAT